MMMMRPGNFGAYSLGLPGEGLAPPRRKASAAQRSGGEGTFQEETLPHTLPYPVRFAAPASPRVPGEEVLAC